MSYYKPSFIAVIYDGQVYVNNSVPVQFVDDPDDADFCVRLKTENESSYDCTLVDAGYGPKVCITNSVYWSNSLDELGYFDFYQLYNSIMNGENESENESFDDDYEPEEDTSSTTSYSSTSTSTSSTSYSSSYSSGSYKSNKFLSIMKRVLIIIVSIAIIGAITFVIVTITNHIREVEASKANNNTNTTTTVPDTYELRCKNNLNDSSYVKMYYKDTNEEITNGLATFDRTVVMEAVQKNGYVLFGIYDVRGSRIKDNQNDFKITKYGIEFSRTKGYEFAEYNFMFAKLNVSNPQYVDNIKVKMEKKATAYYAMELEYDLKDNGEFYGYFQKGKYYSTSDANQVRFDVDSWSSEDRFNEGIMRTLDIMFQPSDGYIVSFKKFVNYYGSAYRYPQKYREGDTVKISVEEKDKKFNGFYIGGELLSLDKECTFIMPNHNVEIEIKWE